MWAPDAPTAFIRCRAWAVFTDMGDTLAITPAPDLSLTIGGPFAKGLDGEGDNLVLRAARALGNGGAALRLTKKSAGGLGHRGGSADAAAALRGLAQFVGQRCRPAGDRRRAGVPTFRSASKAAPPFMEGRGEILHPVESLPAHRHAAGQSGRGGADARRVCRALQPAAGWRWRCRRGASATIPPTCCALLETTRNDLEAPALAIQPVIGEVQNVIATLPGALFTPHVGLRRHLLWPVR